MAMSWLKEANTNGWSLWMCGFLLMGLLHFEGALLGAAICILVLNPVLASRQDPASSFFQFQDLVRIVFIIGIMGLFFMSSEANLTREDNQKIHELIGKLFPAWCVWSLWGLNLIAFVVKIWAERAGKWSASLTPSQESS